MTLTIDARLSPIIAELLDGAMPVSEVVEQVERKYIDAAMARTKGNVTKAAKLIGIHRNTLHNKLRSLELEGLLRAQRSLTYQMGQVRNKLKARRRR